jgi:hypothetical protein
MVLKGLLIAAAGLFSLCGAFFDWDWFINHRKAQFFNNIWGRQGTRLFYGILGSALVVIGVASATGHLT